MIGPDLHSACSRADMDGKSVAGVAAYLAPERDDLGSATHVADLAGRCLILEERRHVVS